MIMFPGLNPRDVEKVMKKMGIKQESIDANEVIIKCADKDLVIKQPQVSKVNMMGQDTLQIIGKIEEVKPQTFSEDDVKVLMEQAKVTADKARDALEKTNGDLAQALLMLKK